MTLRTIAAEMTADKASATASVWMELSKPRLVGLVLVTTIAGFTMASPAALSYLILIHTMLFLT